MALGVGLALNSLVGPLAFDLVDYPLSEMLMNQTIGLDAVGLFVIAPASFVAAEFVRSRRRLLGLFSTTVIGSFIAYMFVQFVVGPDYLHYPGTMALQLALFIGGWITALGAWNATARAPMPPMTARSARGHSWVMVAVAGFVALRYLAIIPAAISGDSIPEESLAEPAMLWTITLMDLGIFVPATVATVVALRRSAPWAQRALYVLTGWFVLVTVAVWAMSIAMVINDDPYGAPAQIVLFSVTAALVIAYATVLYRPLWQGSDTESRAGRTGPRTEEEP